MTVSLQTNSAAKLVETLIGQMTLDEKLAQLGSFWVFELQTKGLFDSQKIETKLQHGIGQITRLAGASTLEPRAAAEASNTLQRWLMERTRLGIPAIIHEECCSGAMFLGGTRFPQMIGLASTFEPRLAELMADVIRKQLRAVGAHQGLSPVLDISRDPRWGRVEETFGEDPTLASHFGMAYVRGLQGKDLDGGVAATAKHFIGHSLSLGGLNCGPVHLGKNELWNTFLTPFHAAIRDADLASIMCSYPELDGELVAASRRILTDLLRNSLGFENLVVSDYNAINMIHDYHFIAPDLGTAAQLALEAGVDVELPTVYCYGDPLRAALDAGEIDMGFIDTAVRRHLDLKTKLGLFENPFVDEGRVAEVFESRDGEHLARKIAEKSMILLKNDGVLPFSDTVKTISVIGPNADSGRNQMGDYSYAAVLDRVGQMMPEDSSFTNADMPALKKQTSEAITVLEGIRSRAKKGVQVLYARGCDNLDNDATGFEEAIATASNSDVVVLVVGDRSGLSPECTTGETRDSANLTLPGAQGELAKAILELDKPVVVVLINGRPLALPWLDAKANAIVEAWLPGEQGGAAVADVLFGNVNPGGKLPVSVPRHVGQVPIFYNHKPSGMFSNWHGDYVDEVVAPLYPFGFGLSYTQFEYKELFIDQKQLRPGETVVISVKVANIGKVAGDEVVQLYTRDTYASTSRPVMELRGYSRLTLTPGEQRTVIFQLPVNQLAFFNNDLKLVLEPGSVEVMVGSSSVDIRLRGDLDISAAAELSMSDRVFLCPVELE